MPLPKTTASRLSPVAAAICCAATNASNEVRLSAPSRCSIKRSIPLLIIPPSMTSGKLTVTREPAARLVTRHASQLDHSCVEAKFLDEFGRDFGGLAFEHFGLFRLLRQVGALDGL